VGSVALAASASSGLPVGYSVVSGPAMVSGGTLMITGAGSVTVQATQGGNTTYAAATPVSIVIMVDPAMLYVTANNACVELGLPIPALTGTLTGVIAGDGITASFVTTAVQGSPVGTYPITPLLNDPNGKLPNYIVTATNGTLTVVAPGRFDPWLLWMSPRYAKAGSAGFTLMLRGANFTAKSVVLWNGSARKTHYVNSTELMAAIPASDVATAGTDLVSVANPAPHAATSDTLTFRVVKHHRHRRARRAYRHR
jgi:hypothetical protein